MKRVTMVFGAALSILVCGTPVVGYTNKDLRAARGTAAVVSVADLLYDAVEGHLHPAAKDDSFVAAIRRVGEGAHVANGMLNGALEQNDMFYEIRRSISSIKRDKTKNYTKSKAKQFALFLLAYGREISKDCASNTINRTWSADQQRLVRRGVRLGVDAAVDTLWFVLLCACTENSFKEAFWNHLLVEFLQDALNESVGEILKRYAEDSVNPEIGILNKIEQIIKGETNLSSLSDLFMNVPKPVVESKGVTSETIAATADVDVIKEGHLVAQDTKDNE